MATCFNTGIYTVNLVTLHAALFHPRLWKFLSSEQHNVEVLPFDTRESSNMPHHKTSACHAENTVIGKTLAVLMPLSLYVTDCYSNFIVMYKRQ